MTLEEIGALARKYADARHEFEELQEAIQSEARRVVRQKMRSLKGASARVSATRDALKAAIEATPALFESPRTHAVDGIKFGYRKSPGKFEAADEAKAIERIRKHLPDLAERLIRTKETLSRPALKTLTAKDLGKIGVTLVDDGDEIVIAAAKTDLDKLVAILVPDGDEE